MSKRTEKLEYVITKTPVDSKTRKLPEGFWHTLFKAKGLMDGKIPPGNPVSNE